MVRRNHKIAHFEMGIALVCALAWPIAALSGEGVSAVGVSSDGALVVSTNGSDISLGRTSDFLVENSASGDSLLAVGPGSLLSDGERTWISILGQEVEIDGATAFPRGSITVGDYVAVSGDWNTDGTSLANNVVRLGGKYSLGISPVYLRGQISNLDATGTARIGDTVVDLTSAYYDPSLQEISELTLVEVLGVEVPALATGNLIAAQAASILSGITGSGARGITGSGARGITGSGARGITGSGARGITGSGARGITGSGARGITGSGARGITGSGVRGITGSGVRTHSNSDTD